ncbi:MAG: LysR family transcriptional regulator [Lachnospiraceae bacterium]|nr:LysR family transcriptional regulator [Lachnospiraceae bacterium]
MELSELNYFMKVAETLSFSKAASKLYISQPSMSRKIAQLESELGVQLFVRNRKKVELTDDGRFLYVKAKDIIENIDKLPGQLADYSQRESSSKYVLKVGITDVLLNLPVHAKAFLYAEQKTLDEFPNVRIDMINTHMAVLQRDMRNNMVDLAIVITDDLNNKNITGIDYDIFKEYNMLLVTDKNSGLGQNEDKETLKDYLEGKQIFVPENRARVLMHASQICSQLDARPINIDADESPRLFIRVARGECAAFSWHDKMQWELSDELTYTNLPVPAAKIYCFMCRSGQSECANYFEKAYYEYIDNYSKL